MKSRTVYEHEYMRHNVTPAQFLAYLRTMQKKHPGELCNDFDLNMFAAKGWSATETAEQEQTEEQTTETAPAATETTKKPTHTTPAKLAKEYNARTHTNRSRLQRPRLPEWGSLCNSISWRWHHTAEDITA